MGLFDKLRAELIDIIEWEEQDPDILVHRFERRDNEIKMGAKLIVRPGQRAVFVNEGQIADSFENGTFTLETSNMPILSTLKGWKYGFHSPFKAEVYFINATEQLNRKWGTPSPVMMRDADFGTIRLRARGIYSYKVGLTEEMISRFVGARDDYTATDLEGQLRTQLVSGLSDLLGESKIPALDLLSQYDELSAEMKSGMADTFGAVGLDLLAFTVENIDVPEAVQKAMDERAAMGALGNMNKYAQYQAANALRDAANNEGGGAGNMMGMMLGGQLANGMGGVLNQPDTTPAASTTPCSKCQTPLQAGAKFCPSCGTPVQAAGHPCIKCSADLPAGAKFCPSCGSAQEVKCVKCGVDLTPGSKFCASCGAAQS